MSFFLFLWTLVDYLKLHFLVERDFISKLDFCEPIYFYDGIASVFEAKTLEQIYKTF